MIFKMTLLVHWELIQWPYYSNVICDAKESGNQKLQYKHRVLNATYAIAQKRFYKSAKSDFHQKLPTVWQLCDRPTSDCG